MKTTFVLTAALALCYTSATGLATAKGPRGSRSMSSHSHGARFSKQNFVSVNHKANFTTAKNSFAKSFNQKAKVNTAKNMLVKKSKPSNKMGALAHHKHHRHPHHRHHRHRHHHFYPDWSDEGIESDDEDSGTPCEQCEPDDQDSGTICEQCEPDSDSAETDAASISKSANTDAPTAGLAHLRVAGCLQR